MVPHQVVQVIEAVTDSIAAEIQRVNRSADLAEGVRALSHARVDERAGLPPGSTSNWFRTRRALLGGVVARVGSVVYDGSVARQLEKMKEQLVESGQ